MEEYLIKKSKNQKIHQKYDTYIFGNLNEEAHIYHSDARLSK